MQQACPDAAPPADFAAAAVATATAATAAGSVPNDSITARMQHSLECSRPAEEPGSRLEEDRCMANCAQPEGLGEGREGAATRAVGSSSDDSASMAVQLCTDALGTEVSNSGLSMNPAYRVTVVVVYPCPFQGGCTIQPGKSAQQPAVGSSSIWQTTGFCGLDSGGLLTFPVLHWCARSPAIPSL